MAFDGEPVATLETNSEGEGSVVITVPLVPGGVHTVSVYNYTVRQEGTATLKVVANVEVSPASVEAPGVVTVKVTGLAPGQAFNIYIDANWVSKLVADEKGYFEGALNIPLVASGAHEIGVYLDNGTELASATIQVTSSIDDLKNMVSGLYGKLDNVVGTVSLIVENAKGEILASINTQAGRILAKIDNLNASLAALIVSKTGEVQAILDTEIGAVVASLEALNATISGVIQDQYGNLYAVLDTNFGKVLARLDAVNATLVDVVVNSKGEIIAELTDGFNQVNVKLGDISDALNQISSKIDQLPNEITGQVTPKLEEAMNKAENARNVAYAATAIGVAALAGAGLSVVRRS